MTEEPIRFLLPGPTYVRGEVRYSPLLGDGGGVVPGVVGRLGGLLGEAGINIAENLLARTDEKDEAMPVLRLDQLPADDVAQAIAALAEIESVDLVDLETR